MALRCGLDGNQKKLLHKKDCKALEQNTQGSSEVTIPGSVHKPYEYGT